MLNIFCEHIQRQFDLKKKKCVWNFCLIIEPVVLLSSVSLCIAAVFFNNRCCLPLSSLKSYCIVMLFWNHWFKRWCWMAQINIWIFPALDAHSWASCFARSKVDILQSVQWHGGAVFNIMYFLYCSIHCTFYCWAIKQRKNPFVSFLLLKCELISSHFLILLYCFTTQQSSVNSLADHSTSIDTVCWNFPQSLFISSASGQVTSRFGNMTVQ